jgi:hypothetical protein
MQWSRCMTGFLKVRLVQIATGELRIGVRVKPP